MNRAQLGALIGASLRTNVRRLTTWIFAVAFLSIAFLLYRGGLGFGGMSATGAKLGTNSEYAIAAILGAFSFMLMHFTATMCGDPVSQDFRLGVAPLLRATPMSPRTYLVGRFLGGYLSLLVIYAVFLAALILGQLVEPKDGKLTLPFRIWPYAKFAVWFLLVPTFFVGALSFAIGTLTRNMKMVYMAVTGLFIAWFLVLQLTGEAALRYIAWWEPSGMAWLAEKVAKGRGNAWLNEHPISVTADLPFLANRFAYVAIGVIALAWTIRRFPKLELDSDVGGQGRGVVQRVVAWFRFAQVVVEDRYQNWVGHAAVPRVEPAPRSVGLWLSQLRSSLATELRLLMSERSLWIMAPVIMLFAGVSIESFDGAFDLPLYPVSSEYAAQMVLPLLLMLAGTTIFYTGEVFHRDDASGVRSIIYSTPVSNGAMLLAKFAAMVLLSLFMVVLTGLTVIVNQLVRWWSLDERTYVDLRPFLELGWAVILPAIVTMCAIALAINVLLRGRYLAYFACILLGAAYVWYVGIKGHRSLLWNPLFIGHWGYSDMTRTEPYAEEIRLHHLYWGLAITGLLALCAWFVERTQGGWKQLFSPANVSRRPVPIGLALAAFAGALAAGFRIEERGNLRGTRSEREARALAYEDRYAAELEAPRLAYDRVELDVALHPETRLLDVRGTLSLVNAWPEPVRTVRFTIDPLYEVRRLELEGARGAPERDGAVVTFTLDRPLEPGAHTQLHLDWSGIVNPGFAEDGGPQSTFLQRSAVFLSSFGPEVIPVTGVASELFLADEDRRKEHGREKLHLLQDKSGEEFVPSVFNTDVAFQYRVRVEAPANLTVLSVGVQVGEEDLGATHRTTWKSDGPVRSFAILAYDYASEKQDGDQVFYHSGHPFNVPIVMRALQDARKTFGERFAPYPHAELKIAEFPRLANFAQSYPSLMPYSESIGFLTNFEDNKRFVDATYFVTAHEVAHQWWGYVLHAGASLGAQVLVESLAEYSAMLLLDEQRGERMRLVFLKNEEDRYLRGRNPDKEVPLAQLESEGGVYWYNKGSLVFYMLERQIGRDKLVAALSSFAQRWSERGQSDQPSYPTIDDLLAEIRKTHAGLDLAWFYDQWFRKVVMPDVRLDSATMTKSGDTWLVDFSATNVGTGRAVILAEAYSGTWDLEADQASDDFVASAGLRLTLEPGETVRGTLPATFQPGRLILDRLYECIDFDRTNNLLPLEPAPGPQGPTGPAPAAGRN